MKYVPIGVLTFVMAFGLSARTQAQQISSELLPPDESKDKWSVCSDDALCSSGDLLPTEQEQDDWYVFDDEDDYKGRGKGRNGCAGMGGIWSNTALFFAGDGWNSIADGEDNNNFGLRAGFNSAVGIGEQPIRAQFGASYGGYNFYGREEAVNRAGAEQQVFLTGGLYMPSDVCCDRRLSGGIVWDYMHGENFGEFGWNVNLNQIRGQVGYALSDATEIGVWGAFSINEDEVDTIRRTTTPLSAMNQLSAYWKRNWDHGADTMAYIGGAQEPGQLALGLRGHAPLSCRVALFGNMHYVVPSTSPGDIQPNGFNDSYSEETWNMTFGIVFYPGGKAASGNVSGHAGLPYLPVADNGTFAVRRPTNLF